MQVNTSQMDYVLPNELVDGMITAGGKKSTVDTNAVVSLILKIAASSLVDDPTNSLGSLTFGNCSKTCSRSFGLNLDAQPAQDAKDVRLGVS